MNGYIARFLLRTLPMVTRAAPARTSSNHNPQCVVERNPASCRLLPNAALTFYRSNRGPAVASYGTPLPLRTRTGLGDPCRSSFTHGSIISEIVLLAAAVAVAAALWKRKPRQLAPAKDQPVGTACLCCASANRGPIDECRLFFEKSVRMTRRKRWRRDGHLHLRLPRWNLMRPIHRWPRDGRLLRLLQSLLLSVRRRLLARCTRRRSLLRVFYPLLRVFLFVL